MIRRLLATACALTLCAAARAAAPTQILQAEPIQVSASDLSTARLAPATTSFQSHGRQFDLALESNERLLSQLSPREKSRFSAIDLYRGRITGATGSWVRLTRSGSRLQGMIWDGREMFVIEPADQVAGHLLSSIDASGDAPVMYRLADVVTDVTAESCRVLEADAAADASSKPAAARSYDSLVHELRSVAASAASMQMEVAVVGDYEFVTQNNDPLSTALARMNAVDGIFSEQVGVRLVFPVIRFFESAADGLDEDDPTALINRFAQHRNSSPDIRDRGVAHLFTGRDLAGSVVGIAYRGTLCHPTYGVSLSQGSLTFANSTLVAAHEIGHNFGAPHDNETNSACSSTGSGFLMSPRLNESGDQFSQCSLAQLQPMIDAAQQVCLSSTNVRDASVNVEPRTRTARPGQSFVYPIAVAAMGTSDVSAVVVTATLPSAVTLLSTSVTEGSCASGGGTVTCNLGTLVGNTSRRIDLNLQGTTEGTFGSTVTLTAQDDENAANNVVEVTLDIRSSPPPGGGTPPAESSGGGGELGWLTLLALLARFAVRVIQRARNRISSIGTGRPRAKPCA